MRAQQQQQQQQQKKSVAGALTLEVPPPSRAVMGSRSESRGWEAPRHGPHPTPMLPKCRSGLTFARGRHCPVRDGLRCDAIRCAGRSAAAEDAVRTMPVGRCGRWRCDGVRGRCRICGGGDDDDDDDDDGENSRGSCRAAAAATSEGRGGCGCGCGCERANHHPVAPGLVRVPLRCPSADGSGIKSPRSRLNCRQRPRNNSFPRPAQPCATDCTVNARACERAVARAHAVSPSAADGAHASCVRLCACQSLLAQAHRGEQCATSAPCFRRHPASAQRGGPPRPPAPRSSSRFCCRGRNQRRWPGAAYQAKLHHG